MTARCISLVEIRAALSVRRSLISFWWLKTIGATVYAGTVVEEGECVLTTRAEGGANRYDKIVEIGRAHV